MKSLEVPNIPVSGKGEDNKGKVSVYSRREFLKKTTMALAGVGATWIGADKLQQSVREVAFEKENLRGLPRVIEEMKGIYPEIDQWIDATEWAASVVQACKKNDVPATRENFAIILTIIRSSSGFRESPRSFDNLPTPLEGTVRDVTSLEPKTGGPMEVSYDEVAINKNINHEQAIDFVDTRDGGIESGVEKLRRILQLYSSINDEESRLKCVFADWNAGKGRSKTAGIQRYINSIAGTDLAEDGVMGPETIEFIEKFRKEIETANIESVPASLPVRGFVGFAKKTLTNVGTSRDYAEKRFQEYMGITKLIHDYEN